MAALNFDEPGHVKDFSNAAHWHATMAAEAKGIVRELVGAVLNKNPEALTDDDISQHAPSVSYVDPVSAPPSNAGETIPIAPWPAFPRAVERKGPWTQFPHHPQDPRGNYRAAEQLGDEDYPAGRFVDANGNLLDLPVRHRQDEYLEWVARRDSDGKLSKVIFVAEGYDYYAALFEHDEQRVVDLYRDFTGVSTIKADDLRATTDIFRQLNDGRRRIVARAGGFNWRNRFNIDPGIVHLSHRANSLGAEVNLAGVSGILRLKVDGSQLAGDNAEELLCCCAGGDPNRNSDPLISAQAYGQVKQGYRYTLANPVGLYIADVDRQRVLTKNGDPLTDDWWTPIRGEGFGSVKTSRVLRLELAPPRVRV